MNWTSTGTPAHADGLGEGVVRVRLGAYFFLLSPLCATILKPNLERECFESVLRRIGKKYDFGKLCVIFQVIKNMILVNFIFT